jgi:ketosteroid isomerase-like protein
VKGREEITKRYQAIFAGKTPRLPLESEELWVLDDVAVSRGVTRAPSTRRNVKGAIRNRYVMTLKRKGDSWEIDTLVWNPMATTGRREE